MLVQFTAGTGKRSIMVGDSQEEDRGLERFFFLLFFRLRGFQVGLGEVS